MWLKLNWSDELTGRLTLEHMSTMFPEADGDVTLGLKHGETTGCLSSIETADWTQQTWPS